MAILLGKLSKLKIMLFLVELEQFQCRKGMDCQDAICSASLRQ
jgi:hypothetical protein